MDNIMKTGAAAELIRARRVALGLSQRRLCSASNCSLASLENIENGYIPKRSHVVPRILEALTRLESDLAHNDEAPARNADASQ